MNTVYIYGLYDPRNDELRYIGKSHDPNGRYKAHLDEAKNNIEINPYKNRWIRKLLADNLNPILRIIEECSEQTWKERERFLISEFRSKNFRLTNIQDGGQGGLTEESRKKLSKSRKGYKIKEETKRKLSQINKGKKLSDEVKDKISKQLKGEKNPFYGKKHPQEIMDIIIKANKGTTKSQETKKKISESRKGHITTEETRRKISIPQQGNKNHFYGKHHTEESKQKISVASKSRQRVVAYLITCARRNNDFALEEKLQNEYLFITGKYKV